MASYRLLSYSSNTGSRPGILIDNKVYDLNIELEIHAPSSSFYPTLDSLLIDWDNAEMLLRKVSDDPRSKAKTLDGLTLCQPIENPRAIYCAAANYYDHAAEVGLDINKTEVKPYFFIKSSSAVIGTGEPICLPMHYSKEFDWEIEIAAVIGRKATNISVDQAGSCLAGYTILNDLSARDHRRRKDWPFGTDWFEHKSFETSAPMGPWITPVEEIDDIQALPMRTWINEELKQNSSSTKMVFTISEQISHISKQLTLRPGDVIATGTCAGVGGSSNTFLKPGDTIRMEVGGLGVLTNPVTKLD